MEIVDEDDELVEYKALCTTNDGLKRDNPLGYAHKIIFSNLHFFSLFLRIFLIDHAWTYRLSEAKKHLREIDGLAARMKNLMNIQVDLTDDNNEAIGGETYKERIIEGIIENMWKYNQTYNLTTENMVCEINGAGRER